MNIGNNEVDTQPVKINYITSNEQYEDNLTGLLNGAYLTGFGKDYLVSKLRSSDQPRVIMFNVIGMHGYLEGDRFVVLSTNTDYIAKIKQLQKFVLRNYSVGGIKAGIYYYINPRESIKSTIDKARKALQYTGDDLTKLYVCSINNFGHYLDTRREVKEHAKKDIRRDVLLTISSDFSE